MTTIDEALFASAKGGFWIDEAGAIIPVVRECEHSDVAEQRWGTSYYGSYASGRIRVSFCGNEAVYVSMGLASTSFPALKGLSQILRHAALPSQHVEIEDEYVCWNGEGRNYKFLDDKGASHAAAWAMKQAMIKRLAVAPTAAVRAENAHTETTTAIAA